jgi:hypothetical protein
MSISGAYGHRRESVPKNRDFPGKHEPPSSPLHKSNYWATVNGFDGGTLLRNVQKKKVPSASNTRTPQTNYMATFQHRTAKVQSACQNFILGSVGLICAASRVLEKIVLGQPHKAPVSRPNGQYFNITHH